MYMGLENPHIHNRAEIFKNDLDKIMQWASKWKTEFNEGTTELVNITRNKNYQFQSLNFRWTILEDSHSLFFLLFFILSIVRVYTFFCSFLYGALCPGSC